MSKIKMSNGIKSKDCGSYLTRPCYPVQKNLCFVGCVASGLQFMTPSSSLSFCESEYYLKWPLDRPNFLKSKEQWLLRPIYDIKQFLFSRPIGILIIIRRGENVLNGWWLFTSENLHYLFSVQSNIWCIEKVYNVQ